MGRKNKTLSLEEKEEILRRLDKGAFVTSLAKQYGVAHSTICNIKKQKQKIRDYIANTSGRIVKRRTLRPAEYPEMESALFTWFLQQRSRHVPISGVLLAAKAKHFCNKIYGHSRFNASKGWLDNFKKRYGIRLLKITGEKLSSDSAKVAPFKEKLLKTVSERDLTRNQIYNADESSLYWRLLPTKTMVSVDERTAPGRKSNKERVTFLVASNASGENKLKLLVIGKAKNPRALKNFHSPVDYKSTKNAWMSRIAFLQWFHESFVKQVRSFLREKGLPEKALLLLDNAPCHPSESELMSDDGHIRALFLPPNCTPLIQPMDQNVINLVKLGYRSQLLNHVVSAKERDVGLCIKNINMRDVLTFLDISWKRLSSDSIRNCWKPLNDALGDPEDEIPLAVLRNLLQQISVSRQENLLSIRSNLEEICEHNLADSEINEWIYLGDGSEFPTGSKELDDAEILQTVSVQESEESENEEISTQQVAEVRIKGENAIKSLDIFF